MIKQNRGEKEGILRVYGENIRKVSELMDLIAKDLHFKRTSKAKIYTQKGLELQDDDLEFLSNQQILYYDFNGGPFDNSQMVDLYEKQKLLGRGGFGSVYKAKHKETGQIVAIKYMNLTEYSKLFVIC